MVEMSPVVLVNRLTWQQEDSCQKHSLGSDHDEETRTEDSPIVTSGCSPPQASLLSHSPFGKVCLTS